MPYDKKHLYKVTSRLYKELKDGNNLLTLRKMANSQGSYDYGTEEICLDYRKELIPTLIHEYLHKWHPDKCETWILNLESRIVNALSIRQIKNIIKSFGAAI
jgi:hypothetical protein